MLMICWRYGRPLLTHVTDLAGEASSFAFSFADFLQIQLKYGLN